MRLRDPKRYPTLRLPARSVASPGLGSSVGEEIELTAGAVAHGGHCVARIENNDAAGQPNPDGGRVVFVRHALPGERVLARITDKGKIWRADAIAVLDNESPYRVPPCWPEAGPNGVGGGELSHVSPAGQRLWKAAVLAEQMRRLAGVDVAKVNPSLAISALTFQPLHHAHPEAPGAEPAANWPEAAGYRTRIDLISNAAGQLGMRQARSHDVVPLTDMPLATDRLREFAAESGIWQQRWPAGSRVTIEAPNRSNPVVLLDGEPLAAHEDTQILREFVRVGDRTYEYQIAPGGFWQVHANAPETLVAAVLAAAGDLEARRVLELYSGSGLFTLPLAVGIGPKGKLITVEGAKAAVESAQRNLAALREQMGKKALPPTEQLAGSVGRTLTRLQMSQPHLRFNLIVVDPPREGLEKGVVEQLATFEADRIIYISCDPAALARDTSRLIQTGYQLINLRAFDLFPHTHHVESIAFFDRIEHML